MVRFEVHDIREINLEKSTAVISGNLLIEIKYNKEVKKLIDETNEYLKAEKKKDGGKYEKYKNLLKI